MFDPAVDGAIFSLERKEAVWGGFVMGAPRPRTPSEQQYSDRRLTIQVNVTPTGRMSLPADIRKRLGLTGGGAVYVNETDDGIVLRTVTQAVSRAQAISRALLDGKATGSVDEFIAERRQWQE